MGRKVSEISCVKAEGSPGLPVPNKPYGFCGRKITSKKKVDVCVNVRVLMSGLSHGCVC